MPKTTNTGTDAPNGGMEPTRFQVLTVDYSYDNPVMVEPEEQSDRVGDTLPDYRKLSVISNSMYTKNSGGGSRRSSRDMGIQVTNVSILPELFPTSMYEDPQWYQLTHDAVPRMEHYRRSTSVSNRLVRPTLEELHNPKSNRQNDASRKISVMDNPGMDVHVQPGAVKFGWIRGVYIRCLLNIWGVMLFLRMGWMVGQAGIGYSILVVVIATIITIVTTLSMSAICTNGEVKGGGVYYMISRSLGPEFGGAIGMIFFVANSVAVSMYIVGAAETVRDLLLRFDVGIAEYPSDLNDVRIAGVILLILVVCVTGIGMAFENKAQLILLVLLLAAMTDYFVGACLPPTVEQFAKGFVGWNMEVAKTNLGPGFRDSGFFDVFSIFFPSVIGILAGANISGDLKDPSSAIPKGTILAILTTSFSYILIIIWLGCTLVRDASGDLGLAANITAEGSNMSVSDLASCLPNCKHGMLNYNPVMEMASAWGPLIYVGIFAATLSSALAALVSAPRIFQALCKDQIFPRLKIFAKGYGPNDDPRRATIIVFIIAFLCTCIGELDAIAPVISNFFMCSYCLVNFSCFHATFVKSPGFRPAFRYYNQWLSLVGAIVCLVVMFIMSWVTALATLAIVLGFYIYINRNQPDVNWGSSTQGYIYKNALSSVTKLSTVEDHVKNYRPAILVLTGNTSSRPPLVDFANTITKNLGLMVCGHIIKNTLSPGLRKAMIDHNVNWLINRKVKAFYSLFQCESLDEGIRAQLELVGLGKMRPNILLMGYKTKWQDSSPKSLDEYFNAIHGAFDLHLSVGILRVKEGLDFKHHLETEQGIPFSDAPNSIPRNKKSKNFEDAEEVKVTRKPPIKEDSSDSESEPSCPESKNSIHLEVMPSRKISRVVPDLNAKLAHFRRLSTVDVSKLGVVEIPPHVINSLNFFQKKQKGFIDVWWLYDDGGLTMLIPYLLTTRSLWKSCQLRVFCISHKKHALDQTQVNIQSLLKKFRIDFSAVTIVTDVGAEPQEENKRKFQKLISKWVSESDIGKGSHTITKTELSAHKERTTRNIRLRELLELHSKDNASLIVMTLPMPRKKACPSPLYMAWLETLTKDMPPFLLVRGNQESVLTYYS